MKNNPKLLILLCVIGVAIIFGFSWAGMESHSDNQKRNDQTTDSQPTDQASGDNVAEILRKVVATQQSQTKKIKAQADRIKLLQNENSSKAHKELVQAKKALVDMVHNAKSTLESQIQEGLGKVGASSKSRAVNASKASNTSTSLEYDIGDGSHSQLSGAHVISVAPDLTAQETIADNSTGLGHVHQHSSLESPSLPSDEGDNDSIDRGKDGVPYYRIPKGAMAVNAALLSPIVAEVPVNGQLLAPAFPFKAILGYQDAKDMFASNGIPLPHGVSGMVLEGYSVGNMALSCARPYVTNILFTFPDGHYVVFPKGAQGNASNATQVYPKNTIGYLSDEYNNPCISGKYLTDAPKVIASLIAFGGAQGIGDAIAKSQTQTVSNIAQGTSGTIFNGSLAKYGAGSGLSLGAKEALKWYKDRVNNIFDVVFVSSTDKGKPRRLTLNITKTIPINFNKKGDALAYENSSQMSATDHSFE